MATRKIDTQIARDNLWREMPIKVRYFWFYLLTTDFSTTIGIFHLPLDIVATETDLTNDEIMEYLKFLVVKGLIDFCPQTSEIVIFNYPKYNVFGWNDYMRKMVFKELARVKNLDLISSLINYMQRYILERPNDPRVSYLNNVIWACSQVLKPKEKVGNQKENNKDKDRDSDKDNDSDNDNDKESWETLLGEMENGKEKISRNDN